MPEFFYQAIDNTGENLSGRLEAADEQTAYQVLQSRGLTVFELSASAQNLTPSRFWSLASQRSYSVEEQSQVADLLSSLFDAKLTVAEVLHVASLSAAKPSLQRLFRRSHQRLVDGENFSEALRAENNGLSEIFLTFASIGEKANSLPETFQKLAQYLRKQKDMQQHISSSLIYPAILVAAAFALILVVIFYLGPNLAPIFASFDRPPPALLDALLSLRVFLSNYGLFILIGLLVMALGISVALRRPSTRSKVMSYVYRLPLIGPISQLILLEQLTKAVEMLLRAGETLPSACKTASRLIQPGSQCSESFADASEALEAGEMAASVFKERDQFPLFYKELFKIGEENNRLEDILERLSDNLTTEINRKIQRVLTLLTPAITLIIGLGIGLLVFNIMSLILEINEIAI